MQSIDLAESYAHPIMEASHRKMHESGEEEMNMEYTYNSPSAQESMYVVTISVGYYYVCVHSFYATSDVIVG